MSRNRLLVAALFVAVLVAGGVAADFDKTKWQFSKSMRGHPSGRLSYVTLDREALLNSASDYSDLRVIGGPGKETAFMLGEFVDGRPKPDRLTVTNNAVVPGKYRGMTLVLKKPMWSDRLLIDTPDRNFTCRVEVAGRNENGAWEVLRGDAYIFDFSRDRRVRSVEVSYPQTLYSVLRVRVFADHGKVINASGATVIWVDPKPRKGVVLFDGRGRVTQNAKARTTAVSLSLVGSTLPAGTVRVISSTANYRRKVTVLGSRDGKSWVSIGEGHILKYRVGRFSGDSPNVDFSGGDYDRVRIVIHNADDEPIVVQRVVVSTPERRIQFAPKPGVSYRLFYGSPRARRPTYDIQSLVTSVSTMAAETARYTLGPQERNPDYVAPAKPTKPWLEANQWVIWVAMGGVMLILLLFVLNLAKKIRMGTP